MTRKEMKKEGRYGENKMNEHVFEYMNGRCRKGSLPRAVDSLALPGVLIHAYVVLPI